MEGVLVFALTQKAAAGLNRQMEKKEIEKIYLAVTDRVPSPENATLEDWLKKDGRSNLSAVVKQGTRGAKKARLSYRVIRTLEDERTAGGLRCLTEIRLDTGRHHQIRVQMAHLGTPLLGDRKYYPGTTPVILWDYAHINYPSAIRHQGRRWSFPRIRPGMSSPDWLYKAASAGKNPEISSEK